MQFSRIVVAICAAASTCSASTLYVDLNCTNPTPPYAAWDTAATNIQDAVDVGVDGDTVLVTNGVYVTASPRVYAGLFTNAYLVTNAVAVRSVNGAALTTIDGNNASACMLIANSNAYVDGFTVTRGYSYRTPAGVHIAAGTLDHCLVVSNVNYGPGGQGGGVVVNAGSALINSTIAWNTCTNPVSMFGGDSSGGGVYCFAGIVTNCSIVFNSAYFAGGGVYMTVSSSVMRACYIAGNRVFATNLLNAGGGGVYCVGRTLVDDCVVSSNSAPTSGGGIFIFSAGYVTNSIVELNQASLGGGISGGPFGFGATGVVLNTLIKGNRATSYGGGCYVETAMRMESCMLSSNSASDGGGLYGSVRVRDCQFRSNLATNDGGGLYVSESMMNCSLIGNVAGGRGGGAYYSTFISTQSYNCLVVGNTGKVGGGIYSPFARSFVNYTICGNHASTGGGFFGESGPTLVNSIVYGNTAAAFSNFYAGTTNVSFSCIAPLIPTGTNIDVDPIFVDASAGDYHLFLGSPCIDAGTGGSASTNDLDGIARPLDGDNNGVAAYDMGAYEFASTLADTDGDGMSDGNEVSAGTDPHNGLSVFAIVDSTSDPAGWVVRWSSVAGKQYNLYHCTNLLEAFVLIGTNLPAVTPQNIFTDVNAVADANFYRVQVSP